MSEIFSHSRSSKGEKLAQRLSHILALLHQGDRIEKHELARHFQVDVRTIERDLNERLYGIAERNDDGHWQLAYSARNTIPANSLRSYARMAGTEDLFPAADLGSIIKQIETPEADRAIQVQTPAYEDLRSKSMLFKQLQSAIENSQECSFIYKEKSRDVQPYKLVHKFGVWYLAAVESGRLKTFSVALIELFRVHEGSSFVPQNEYLEYIDSKDDVWFTNDSRKVTLRVAADIAHYFTRRNLLPGQQHRLDQDGSLLVTAQIGHVNQLLPVVRYWLPKVRILQPAEWHEDLVEGLRETLVRWES